MDWHPLWLSFEVAGLATVLTGVVGIALAIVLASRSFPGRDVLDALVTAPLILPPTVLGYYLLVTLGRRSPLGQWYEAVVGDSIVFTVTGAVIAAAVGSLPLVVKSARAALEEVDPQYLRAASTLGAPPWRVLLSVRLPLAANGIVAGLMLGFARALGDFGATLMVAGNIPGETRTASLAIYDAIAANRDGEASGMIAVLSALGLGTLYLVNRLTRRPHA